MERTDVVTYNRFIGVYGVEDAWEIPKEEGAIALKTATNLDINKRYKLKFRNGRTLKLSGDYKNLWSNNSVWFAVKGNDLYRILPGVTFTESLLTLNVGSTYMSYVGVGDLVYMTNNSIIQVWDTDEIRSLRSTSRTYKRSMPPGHLLELYKGRMFIAREVSDKHLIIQSEAGNYERYDSRDDKSYATFTSKVTMMEGVEDGMFITSDRTYFLEGNSLMDMRMTRVSDTTAIIGTAKN
jgi:hypothetical protein